MKLQEQFEEIEKLVEAKNQKAINDYLLANDMPNFIYELAGYKEIREKKVTKIGINVLKVCEKWIPSFKKRPTKKNVEEIITYNNSYFPTKDHIMFFYTYSYGDGSGVEGADTLVDIISSERISFNKEDLVPELKKMKELYEPREGHIKCHYCDRQRLPKDIHQKTIISRMYSNCESPLRNYCNDRPCASYDQMGSEG